jgi:uncharacterized protein (TIGR02246 family)
MIAVGVVGAQPENETDGQAIQVVVAQFLDAWNQHDAHAFAALFSEDADFTNVRGTHAHGRKAVEEFHAPMFATIFKASHQTGQLRSVRFLKPDIAIADIEWEMTGAATPEGAARPPRKGLLDWAMVKIDGRWLIAVMHNTELSEQAIPAQGK